MQLCRFTAGADVTPRFGAVVGETVHDLGRIAGLTSLDEALALPLAQLRAALEGLDLDGLPATPLADCAILAPIGSQEVWACGVTYERSRDARMQESRERDVYDRVYDAERPEIFFKATPSRVVGPGAAVAIRQDSTWDVPEPELALVLNSRLEIVGYTIGNDLSSRSIEGDNPLYLPQAKMYAACCALGPAIVPAWEVADPRALPIRLEVARDGATAFSGETSTARLHRDFADLVAHLGRDNLFPAGAFLLTGTGIVPPDDFTLQPGDVVRIAIDGLGLPPLENIVRRGWGAWSVGRRAWGVERGARVATEVWFEAERLHVALSDGRRISAPLVWFPRLSRATPEQRRNWALIGRGIGIHWPDVDEDLSGAGLLAGRRARS